MQLELSHLEVQQACTNRATIGQMNSNGQVLEWSQRLSLPYDSSEGADKARFSKGNWHAPGPPWMEPDPEIMQHLRQPSVSQNLERLVQSHPSSRTISPPDNIPQTTYPASMSVNDALFSSIQHILSENSYSLH